MRKDWAARSFRRAALRDRVKTVQALKHRLHHSTIREFHTSEERGRGLPLPKQVAESASYSRRKRLDTPWDPGITSPTLLKQLHHHRWVNS